jgi:valyl-tRNA synthetase
VEKERKKAEKDAKFKEKMAKQANATPAASSKSKEKKAAAEKKAETEVLPPYVEETPPGQKKSEYILERLQAQFSRD